MSTPDDIAIVDAHHHLWNLDHLRYPWLTGPPHTGFFLGDNTPIRSNYLPADYRQDSADHNVVASREVGYESRQWILERDGAAIREQQFWILTHPKWIEVLRRRVEGMEDGRQLVSGFGG